jgi:hypothetical protein
VGDTGSIGRDGRDDVRTDGARLNGRAGGRGQARRTRSSERGIGDEWGGGDRKGCTHACFYG